MSDRRRKRNAPEDEFCHYCKGPLDRRNKTIDHIVPASLGGRDERFNYVLACRKCNQSKNSDWPSCKCSKCRKSVRIHWQMYRVRPPKP